MKTLIVHYTARGERSHTKKLLDSFREAHPGHDLVELDLTRDVPDFFLPDPLMAYIRRNYLGEILDPAAAEAISRMDRMTEQVRDADIVVLATPMYNFSLPGIVKAWFDSVMLKGKTWDIGPNGYVGLMKGKKALVLSASGGIYEGDSAGWDLFTPLINTEFGFMGFEDIRIIRAAGINMKPDEVDTIVSRGQDEVRAVVNEWYGE